MLRVELRVSIQPWENLMRYLTTIIVLLCLASCNLTPKLEDTPPSFTPATITWTNVADAPLVRFEAQSVVVADKLYAFGGYTDGSIIPISFEANVYDPKTNIWESLPELPRPITHAGTAEDGESVYLAGGVVGASDPEDTAKISATDEVWRYNTRTRVWSAMPPLPEPRGAGALVVLDDTLHFFGGTDMDRYQEVGEHWTLALDGSTTWEPKAPLLNPRNHLAGIVVDGGIYAIGGQYGHN